MTKVIKLEAYKRRKLGEKSFRFWNAKFKHTFDETTTVRDLPDSILLFLASPGEKSADIIYQLIHQVKYPSQPSNPGTKDAEVEMDLMDIHLYLVDKVRFEMMLRLGWVEDYSNRADTILDLILEFDKQAVSRFDNPPQLSQDHPRFDEYKNLISREKELFIRRLFVNALIEFNRNVHETP